MQILQKGCDLVGFIRKLENSPRSVLMLDYDGTLAPFRVERTSAAPYPEVIEAVRSLKATRTRVVVISGRPALEVAQLLAMDPRPEIWGAHGVERLLPDGRYDVIPLSQAAVEVMNLAEDALTHEGIADLAERKASGIAVHWRGLPDRVAAEVRTAALRAWEPMECAPGIRHQEFDGGIELKVGTATKARPVRAILAEEPEGAPAAYMGDDLTDEEAFFALRGRALTVLVRPERRATRADLWMKPPEELIEFLSGWFAATGGGR